MASGNSGRNPKAPNGGGNAAGAKFVLQLYVTGATPRSVKAIRNLKLICRDHLRDNCEVEVIDLYQQPERARESQIVAAPTLIKSLPLPIRRMVGDLSDRQLVVQRLGIPSGVSG